MSLERQTQTPRHSHAKQSRHIELGLIREIYCLLKVSRFFFHPPPEVKEPPPNPAVPTLHYTQYPQCSHRECHLCT